MFSWLKGSSQEDPITAARNLARDSSIESVFEGGKYSAFLIRLLDNRPAADRIKNQAALLAFVEVIEDRLSTNDFEPVLEILNRIGGMPPPDHTADRAQATRLVVSPDDALVFKWTHDSLP
jgi:hypothetical protein